MSSERREAVSCIEGDDLEQQRSPRRGPTVEGAEAPPVGRVVEADGQRPSSRARALEPRFRTSSGRCISGACATSACRGRRSTLGGDTCWAEADPMSCLALLRGGSSIKGRGGNSGLHGTGGARGATRARTSPRGHFALCPGCGGPRAPSWLRAGARPRPRLQAAICRNYEDRQNPPSERNIEAIIGRW